MMFHQTDLCRKNKRASRIELNRKYKRRKYETHKKNVKQNKKCNTTWQRIISKKYGIFMMRFHRTGRGASEFVKAKYKTLLWLKQERDYYEFTT